MHRVIVWGTGFVGKAVLKSLLGHPAFEVVGVVVHDPAKDGLDVGEIVGGPRTGIIATRDAKSLLARAGRRGCLLRAQHDACRSQHGEHRGVAARREERRRHEHGDLPLPAARFRREYRDRIAQACAAGGTSFLSNGIDPGFANDLFPMTLLGLCGQVESVRTTEFIDGGQLPRPGEPALHGALLEDGREAAARRESRHDDGDLGRAALHDRPGRRRAHRAHAGELLALDRDACRRVRAGPGAPGRNRRPPHRAPGHRRRPRRASSSTTFTACTRTPPPTGRGRD